VNCFEFTSFNQITDKWDIAVVGTHTDDRDIKVIGILKDLTSEVISFSYNSEDLDTTVNDSKVEVDQLAKVLSCYSNKKIVIDATSMNVAELYLIASVFYRKLHIDLDIIYVEPNSYIKSKENDSFSLSDYSLGFEGSGIPTLSLPYYADQESHLFFLLGFEGDRLANALEVHQINHEKCTMVFGVPPYKIGYDRNSFDKNISVLKDYGLTDQFVFCGANNAPSIYRELQIIRKSNSHNKIYIVPIGTKPQAIGALKFLCKDENVSVLYDHPMRTTGRTEGVGKVNLFKSVFS
jgi:hypothetical protein